MWGSYAGGLKQNLKLGYIQILRTLPTMTDWPIITYCKWGRYAGVLEYIVCHRTYTQSTPLPPLFSPTSLNLRLRLLAYFRHHGQPPSRRRKENSAPHHLFHISISWRYREGCILSLPLRCYTLLLCWCDNNSTREFAGCFTISGSCPYSVW